MIVVDLETSGLEEERVGIWQIGALDFHHATNTFLQECRIDDSDYLDPIALKVTGKTEEELRDSSKQSQKQLIANFFDWINTAEGRNMISQNPQILDYTLIARKARQYGLENPISYRCFDLHTIAQVIRMQQTGSYHWVPNKKNPNARESGMNLSTILASCGIPEQRRIVEGENVTREGKPHNALEDAKLTAECFSRLVYGRGLLSEFSQYRVPLDLICRD